MKKIVKFYEDNGIEIVPCSFLREFRTEQEAINWANNNPTQFEEGKEYLLQTVLVKELIEA